MIASETSVVSKLRRSALYAMSVFRFAIKCSGLLEMNTEISGRNKNASITATRKMSTRRPSIALTDEALPFSRTSYLPSPRFIELGTANGIESVAGKR
jgi:hypothetical protein